MKREFILGILITMVGLNNNLKFYSEEVLRGAYVSNKEEYVPVELGSTMDILNSKLPREEVLEETSIEESEELVVAEEISSYNVDLDVIPPRTTSHLFEVSYYCPCAYCCGVQTGITASGTYAVEGVTIALPKDIPFGSKVHIDNVGDFINQDIGGYINYTYDEYGNLITRVDVYVDTHERALELGRHLEYGYIEYDN